MKTSHSILLIFNLLLTSTGYSQTAKEYLKKITDKYTIPIRNHEDAIKEYDKAINLYPDFADGYYQRGFVYHSMGKYREAISDYDKAIKLDSNESIYFIERGFANKSCGNYREVIKDFTKAIEIETKNEMPFYRR